MKTQLTHLASKISFWNLFVGLVAGFALGVIFINALIPDASQLIRAYRLDQKSIAEDKAAYKDSLQGSLEINGN